MAFPPVVALEVGTTKSVALVGEMRDDGHIIITGIGEAPSYGIRKGEVTDMEKARECVRTVLSKAEESGHIDLADVHLAVSGGHLLSMTNRGMVRVMDPQGGITDPDIEQVMEVARTVNLPPEHEVLHTICQYFTLDGQTCVSRPLGMEGAQLAADMLILFGVRSRLHNTARVVESVPVEVSDTAFSGLCSALAVLSPEQKKSGVVVIDIGGGTTDYLAYAEGAVAGAGALGVGGDHVTNDIAIAFGIPTVDAENLKKESGSAVLRVATVGQRVAVPAALGAAPQSVSVKALHTVINARVEEMLTLVHKRLESDGVLPHVGAGIVLTGGGALMRGVDELAQRVFGLRCTIGRPRNVGGLSAATGGPEYATCCGLVQYAFRSVGAASEEKGIFNRLGRWLSGK